MSLYKYVWHFFLGACFQVKSLYNFFFVDETVQTNNKLLRKKTKKAERETMFCRQMWLPLSRLLLLSSTQRRLCIGSQNTYKIPRRRMRYQHCGTSLSEVLWPCKKKGIRRGTNWKVYFNAAKTCKNWSNRLPRVEDAALNWIRN